MSNNDDEYMLTTIDNPYDPFTQFDDWYNFDVSEGYDTCGYLANVAMTSDAMTESEEHEELVRAMDEIIAEDPLGVYYKRKKGDPPPYDPE